MQTPGPLSDVKLTRNSMSPEGSKTGKVVKIFFFWGGGGRVGGVLKLVYKMNSIYFQ